MTAIRNYLNKKGQGIVEYAVLLAFIVGIAVALQGVGLKDAVVGVFDDTAELFASFTDSRTPEEKDKANMELLANALVDGFAFDLGNSAKVVAPENKVAVPNSWMGIVVFADGSVEVATRGWGSEWYMLSEWTEKAETATNANDKELWTDRYNAYMNTLSASTGVDFKDSSALSQKFKINSEQYSNGYVLVYDRDSKKPVVRAVALSEKTTSTSELSEKRNIVDLAVNHTNTWETIKARE